MKYIKKYNEDIDWDWVDEEIREIEFHIGDIVSSISSPRYYNNYHNIFDFRYLKLTGDLHYKKIIDIYNNNGDILIKLDGYWPWFIGKDFKKDFKKHDKEI
jgi:hypothetical protein